MAKLMAPPTKDVTAYLRLLFLRAEQSIIDEITRKRRQGYVDYAEVAALDRIQATLTDMVDTSWDYVPKMIQSIFYLSEKDAAGYQNAAALTIEQTHVIEILAANLLGEITEAAETAMQSARNIFAVGRPENDLLRRTVLQSVAESEALGRGWTRYTARMAEELKAHGIPAFIDKAGRRWSLRDYCEMATRTTARQAQVASLLTAEDHDLWMISKIGSTCPVCAPLEGRVYSKSGTNPNYPPLSLAFGKIDPYGPEDLANTYLNIHPNCLHALIKYTESGKTPEEIEKMRKFSNPFTNPLDRDPRTKKQIAAYREKEKNRRKLLDDVKQWKRYRAVLGDKAYKSFETFRKHKKDDDAIYKKLQSEYRKANKEIKEVLNG